MTTRFISVNRIIFFMKVAEDNKSNMIEVLKYLQTVEEKEGFYQINTREYQQKKDLPHGRSANFEKFENDDKA